MEFYIAPVDRETDFLKISSPEELRVIDPACGSGHMLTYAFDLLYAIYEEEGYAPSDIPELILANNLYGIEIDSRAGALAAFALTMKARARQRTFFNTQVDTNVCVLEPISFTPDEIDTLISPGGDSRKEGACWNQFQHADTMGSLIQPSAEQFDPLRRRLGESKSGGGDLFARDIEERARRVVLQAEFLSSRYHVVVANPPYMGRKNMEAAVPRAEGTIRICECRSLFSVLLADFTIRPPRTTHRDHVPQRLDVHCVAFGPPTKDSAGRSYLSR